LGEHDNKANKQSMSADEISSRRIALELAGGLPQMAARLVNDVYQARAGQ